MRGEELSLLRFELISHFLIGFSIFKECGRKKHTQTKRNETKQTNALIRINIYDIENEMTIITI